MKEIFTATEWGTQPDGSPMAIKLYIYEKSPGQYLVVKPASAHSGLYSTPRRQEPATLRGVVDRFAPLSGTQIAALGITEEQYWEMRP